MNIREIIAKIKSPLGLTVIFAIVLFIGVLIAMPFITRDKENSLKVEENLTAVEKQTVEIRTKVPSFLVRKDSKKKKGQAEETESEHAQEASEPPVISGAKPPKDGPQGNPAPEEPKAQETKKRVVAANPVVQSSSRMRPLQNQTRILVIDGENSGSGNTEDEIFQSERFAPFGRLIQCKLVNTLESNVPDTPVVGLVLEDLWWINQHGEKRLIIPGGTEVHGKIKGAVRNRLSTEMEFTFVWQATNKEVGLELQVTGIALEKSHEAGKKELATITDMAAGIPGQVMGNDNLNEMMQYLFAGIQGAAQGFQSNSVYTTNNTTIVSQDGSTKNAVAMAAESVAQMALQNIADKIAKESYYIRVAAGTEFYVYVTQVLDIEKARIANSYFDKLEKAKLLQQQMQQGNNRSNTANVRSDLFQQHQSITPASRNSLINNTSTLR